MTGKIGIATVQVPFISGGAEILAASLQRELEARGYESEIITMPFKWYPPQTLLDHCRAARLLDLTEVNGEPIERLITLKFPIYYTAHPNKVGWILHQHRQAYDLHGTEFGDLHHDEEGERAVAEIRRLDDELLPEHQALYTTSLTVAARLQEYNGIHAEPVYHPPEGHELLHNSGYGDYVLVPGRLDSIKRQHLIVEALLAVPGLRLEIIGNDQTPYGRDLHRFIDENGLGNRVSMRGVVTLDEKVELFAGARAVYNGVYDEDYGYITLEGFYSATPVITHTDSGGPLEFITDGRNGFVTEPTPAAIADVLRRLASDEDLVARIGGAGLSTANEMVGGWDRVIDALLG